MNLEKQIAEKLLKDAENLICPVCGYYCIGHGGIDCIDKLTYYKHRKAIYRAAVAAVEGEQ